MVRQPVEVQQPPQQQLLLQDDAIIISSDDSDDGADVDNGMCISSFNLALLWYLFLFFFVFLKGYCVIGEVCFGCYRGEKQI